MRTAVSTGAFRRRRMWKGGWYWSGSGVGGWGGCWGVILTFLSQDDLTHPMLGKPVTEDEVTQFVNESDFTQPVMEDLFNQSRR